MTKVRIEPTDREFFTALADIVYGNVFSAKRAERISKILPGATP